MESIYHLRIKKEYAAALIEDLEKMDAVELFRTVPEDYEIPEWQKAEVRAIAEQYKCGEIKGRPWEEVFAELNAANDRDDV